MAFVAFIDRYIGMQSTRRDIMAAVAFQLFIFPIRCPIDMTVGIAAGFFFCIPDRMGIVPLSQSGKRNFSRRSVKMARIRPGLRNVMTGAAKNRLADTSTGQMGLMGIILALRDPIEWILGISFGIAMTLVAIEIQPIGFMAGEARDTTGAAIIIIAMAGLTVHKSRRIRI